MAEYIYGMTNSCCRRSVENATAAANEYIGTDDFLIVQQYAPRISDILNRLSPFQTLPQVPQVSTTSSRALMVSKVKVIAFSPPRDHLRPQHFALGKPPLSIPMLPLLSHDTSAPIRTRQLTNIIPQPLTRMLVLLKSSLNDREWE